MKTPHLFLTGPTRIRAYLLAAASLLCLLAPPAHAAPGDIHATFGTNIRRQPHFLSQVPLPRKTLNLKRKMETPAYHQAALFQQIPHRSAMNPLDDD